MAATETTAGKGLSKGQVFLRRLGSSLVLWAVVLGALFAGNRWVADACFLTIMTLLVTVGMVEYFDLTDGQKLPSMRRWGVFGGALLILSTFFYLSAGLGVGVRDLPAKAGDFESSIIVIWVLGLCLYQVRSHDAREGFIAICTTLFGLLYVAWLLNFIQKIQYFPRIDGQGSYYVLYFILVTKFSDLGAYVTGSLVGRHKMVPAISPGKTWEGFAGAVVISTGASLLCAELAGSRLPGMTLLHAAVLGVVLGVAAVVGDLIESVFKRRAGAKDSGRYIPGIGGVLDLVDSLLFNAPLMYLYLRHILTD